jgi:2-phospho-L-lactate guanylyltransferase
MSGGTGIWAVVPVKEPSAAKQRLARAHPPEFRRGLALAMVEDVISALAASRKLAGLVLVTVDPDAATLGRRYGAAIFADGARDGHTGAVMAAARWLRREVCFGMLTVPGDIPLVTEAEIDAVIAAHGEGDGFTIVPAHDGRGSNAIVMTPPDAVELAFGNDSFLPHLEVARRAGLPPRILRLPGIGLDIDNPEDLALFMRTPSPTRAWAFLAASGLVASGLVEMAAGASPPIPELLRS